MAGEPLHRPAKDGDGGDGGDGRLVVVDLGVRDAGVVVNDGVHERVPKLGAAGSASCLVDTGFQAAAAAWVD